MLSTDFRGLGDVVYAEGWRALAIDLAAWPLTFVHERHSGALFLGLKSGRKPRRAGSDDDDRARHHPSPI